MSRTQRKAVARAGNDPPTSTMFLSSAFRGVGGRSVARPTRSFGQVIGSFCVLISLGAIGLLAAALDSHEHGHE